MSDRLQLCNYCALPVRPPLSYHEGPEDCAAARLAEAVADLVASTLPTEQPCSPPSS